jgi:hypothetical protein
MDQNIENFCDFVKGLLNTVGYTLDIEPGRKYIKLVSNKGGNSRSVWCFINKETGDIMKAASWAAPAKHSRGNVADRTTYETYPWTGPHYLK